MFNMSRRHWLVILINTVLAVGFTLREGLGSRALAGQSPVQTARTGETAQQNSERFRVAEGEYRIYRQSSDGGIGPFNPALHDFAEAWTMWRQTDGTLEVEGERTYEAPQYETHKDAFAVHLSGNFNVLSVTEFKKLRWRPDSGPLSCRFLPQAIDCNSGARDPSQEVRLRLPLKEPYGFLWPISAFSISNITRFAERQAGSAILVSMLTIDEPGPADPVLASVLEGKLRYVGREQIRTAGRKWLADKFELKVPLNPVFILWTSPQGLLLDFTLEDNANRLTEHGMNLVRYQQFADF